MVERQRSPPWQAFPGCEGHNSEQRHRFCSILQQPIFRRVASLPSHCMSARAAPITETFYRLSWNQVDARPVLSVGSLPFAPETLRSPTRPDRVETSAFAPCDCLDKPQLPCDLHAVSQMKRHAPPSSSLPFIRNYRVVILGSELWASPPSSRLVRVRQGQHRKARCAELKAYPVSSRLIPGGGVGKSALTCQYVYNVL